MKQGDDTTRIYLSLPPALAPIQVAVLPLLRKPPFLAKSEKLSQQLRCAFSLAYEASGSIGKRYARQDLLGTPYCLTVDHQTLEDDTLTIRERDTMIQTRIHLSEVTQYLAAHTSLEALLKKLASPDHQSILST